MDAIWRHWATMPELTFSLDKDIGDITGYSCSKMHLNFYKIFGLFFMSPGQKNTLDTFKNILVGLISL